MFAVHISDGVLGTPWLVGGWVVTGLLLAVACRRLPEDEVPRIGVFTAALFVASLFHVKTGPTSVHFVLNGIAGIVLGRRSPIAVTVAVALQFLMLGHGGGSTIGVNAAVSALPGLLAGGLFRLLYGRSRVNPTVAGFAVGLVTILLTVALSATAVALGGDGDLLALAATQVVLHLPVIGIEALGTGFIAGYLAKVKPEWLLTPAASPPQTAPPTDPAPG